ncbi:hypothetical protein C5167_044751 [Papaver somniferum]|nr:hypothetical protein C5167_044751 [Papaver somniferum]
MVPQSDWSTEKEGEEVNRDEVNPPEKVPGPVRRRKRRIRDRDENTPISDVPPRKCKVCGLTGHNRTTCEDRKKAAAEGRLWRGNKRAKLPKNPQILEAPMEPPSVRLAKRNVKKNKSKATATPQTRAPNSVSNRTESGTIPIRITKRRKTTDEASPSSTNAAFPSTIIAASPATLMGTSTDKLPVSKNGTRLPQRTIPAPRPPFRAGGGSSSSNGATVVIPHPVVPPTMSRKEQVAAQAAVHNYALTHGGFPGFGRKPTRPLHQVFNTQQPTKKNKDTHNI